MDSLHLEASIAAYNCFVSRSRIVHCNLYRDCVTNLVGTDKGPLFKLPITVWYDILTNRVPFTFQDFVLRSTWKLSLARIRWPLTTVMAQHVIWWNLDWITLFHYIMALCNYFVVLWLQAKLHDRKTNPTLAEWWSKISIFKNVGTKQIYFPTKNYVVDQSTWFYWKGPVSLATFAIFCQLAFAANLVPYMILIKTR